VCPARGHPTGVHRKATLFRWLRTFKNPISPLIFILVCCIPKTIIMRAMQGRQGLSSSVNLLTRGPCLIPKTMRFYTRLNPSLFEMNPLFAISWPKPRTKSRCFAGIAASMSTSPSITSIPWNLPTFTDGWPLWTLLLLCAALGQVCLRHNIRVSVRDMIPIEK